MIKKLLFISFISFYLGSTAQTIHVFKPNEQNQATVETPAHKDSMSKEDKNCFKWNWTLLARGVFEINYEAYIAGNLTAEFGIGITYRDFEFEFTKTLGSTSDTAHVQQYAGDGANYEAGIGYAGDIGLRYYVSGYDNMEGPFLEFALSYRHYTFTNAIYSSEAVNTPSTFTPGYNFLDGQLKFGYAADNWVNDIITEFYIGIGVRNLTANLYEYVTPNYVTNTPRTQGITIKETYPQPIFGFKVGIPF